MAITTSYSASARIQAQQLINRKLEPLFQAIVAPAGRPAGHIVPGKGPNAQFVDSYYSQPYLSAELYRPGVKHVISPATALGYPLEPLGIAPIFDRPRLIKGDDWLWYLTPVETDPLLAAGEMLRIPRRQLRRLKALRDGGVRASRYFLAHELPLGSVDRVEEVSAELLRPKLPPGAIKLSQRLGLAGTITVRITTAPVGIAGRMARKSLPLGVKIARELPTLLDPVLLGAVAAPDRLPVAGEPALWFELARWVC